MTNSTSSAVGLLTLGNRLANPSLDGVVFMLLLFVAVRIGLSPIQDNSFLTHLATGRLIFERGSVPTVDPYSWTAFGEPWTVQSWGASVIYAAVEKIAGFNGLRLLTAMLVGILLALLWKLTDAASGLVGRLLAGLLVVALGTGMWTERPFLFGAIGLALVLLAANDRLDPRWLVPVMWVWVNTHGSFPFAPVLLVLLAFGRWLDVREEPRVELRALLWVVVGTLAGGVNPIGPRILVFPVQMLERREAFQYVKEWQRIGVTAGVDRVFIAMLILTAVLVVIRARSWRNVLPLLVFGAAAVVSARNILQASIVLTPLLAQGLSGLGRIDGAKRPAVAAPALHAMAVALVVVGIIELRAQPTAFEPYPQEALAWMDANGYLGTEARVISRDVVGNYMEFAYGPDEARVFIDDRVDMFPIEVVRWYVGLIDVNGNYQQILEESRPTAVLWDSDSRFGEWLAESPDWQIAFEDETWVVALPE
ncbi:MAG: hypothetical protein IPG97_08900 [Microthrixaceae bacterium]|nr:hypothetical protein [Microthrixaceae bacterium]